MEAELLQRLREDARVQATAGAFNGEPAIDFDERKSNDVSAFPAAIQTLVAGVRNYDQDGAIGVRTARVRWECFSIGNGDGAAVLAECIVNALEPEATVGSVRFGRSFLIFERSYPPEDIGDLKVFRRIVDMDITATT